MPLLITATTQLTKSAMYTLRTPCIILCLLLGCIVAHLFTSVPSRATARVIPTIELKPSRATARVAPTIVEAVQGGCIEAVQGDHKGRPYFFPPAPPPFFALAAIRPAMTATTAT